LESVLFLQHLVIAIGNPNQQQ